MKNVKNQKPSYVHRGGDTALIGATIWSAFEKTVATYTQEGGSPRLPSTGKTFHLRQISLRSHQIGKRVDGAER